MMKLVRLALPAILLTAAPCFPALAQPAASDAPDTSAIDPRAKAAMDRSRAYLKTLRSFEVRAQATMQDALDNDTKFDLASRVRYEYRAPDRLFIGWQSDRTERRLYYDGKTLSVFSPRIGYYARINMTGSVAQLLQRLARDYGIVFPLPDLFLWASNDAPAYDIQQATYLGPARIVDAETDHYLFRQKDVDWQIWIERGDRPVPRKIVITDRADPAQPSFSALLQWNPDAQLPDNHFTFSPPEAAKAIEMAKLSQEDRK